MGDDPKIESILQSEETDIDDHRQTVLVAPRQGTISPWSSKVGRIIHNT